MTRVEAQINYGEKFLNEYPRIVHHWADLFWFPNRDEISGLKLDLTRYSGEDLDKMFFSVGRLIDYVRMPAIDDNFPTDRVTDTIGSMVKMKSLGKHITTID